MVYTKEQQSIVVFEEHILLNKYPWWKNLMITVAIILGAIYALPNLYGEDLAIQISGARGIALEQADIEKIQGILKTECSDCTVESGNGQALIRFKDNEMRLKTKDTLVKALGDNYIVALNLAAATPAWLRSIGGRPLKLGLDLRGGLHFLMEVDMEEAMKKIVGQNIQDIRTELRQNKIRLANIRGENETIEVFFRDEATMEQAQKILSDKYNDMVVTSGNGKGNSYVVTLVMKPEKLRNIKTSAVEQNINIIRNRVNELGVAEPLVQRQGADRIVVELPGIED